MPYTRHYTRDDGVTEVTVDIEVTTRGEAQSRDHPGCGPECEVVNAWLTSDEDNPNAPKVELTDAERERFEIAFLEDPPEEDYGDDIDWDAP